MAKLCPKCGRDLRPDGFCETCRISVKIYERIKNASKILYNQGLQLAQVRDLSGSIQALQRSVKLDKNNIDARNLLGLVYFEIGETVLALQQWVISKSHKPVNNVAEKYLNVIQDNQTHLERLNSAIKKYNQALAHLNQGSDDLAVIQLKKVISLNPNFVKAYNLLALCLIKMGQEQKAEKILQKVLSVDQHNFTARKYYDAIRIEPSGHDKKEEKDEEEKEAKALQPIKIPNFVSSSFHQVLWFAGGAILGLAVALLLILPSQIDNKKLEIESLKEEVTSQSTSIQSLTEERNALATERDTLKADNATLEAEVAKQSTMNTEAAKLLAAIQSFNNKDYLTTANTLYFIDATALEGSDLGTLYTTMKTDVYALVAYDAYKKGTSYYTYKTTDYYTKAVEQYDITLKYVPQGVDYIDETYYYRGVSLYRLGRLDEARKDLETVINTYPDSDKADDATWYLGQF